VTELNASSEEDAKIVAALDTKYQAAVKSNDAAAMDQILADDFILVTGRGKLSSTSETYGSLVGEIQDRS
jgi:ketosteroid isomerase-like protein